MSAKDSIILPFKKLAPWYLLTFPKVAKFFSVSY